MGAVGMKLEQLWCFRLFVHKDLITEFVFTLSNTQLVGLVSDQVITYEAVLSLLVTHASRVTLFGLL